MMPNSYVGECDVPSTTSTTRRNATPNAIAKTSNERTADDSARALVFGIRCNLTLVVPKLSPPGGVARRDLSCAQWCEAFDARNRAGRCGDGIAEHRDDGGGDLGVGRRGPHEL